MHWKFYAAILAFLAAVFFMFDAGFLLSPFRSSVLSFGISLWFFAFSIFLWLDCKELMGWI